MVTCARSATGGARRGRRGGAELGIARTCRPRGGGMGARRRAGGDRRGPPRGPGGRRARRGVRAVVDRFAGPSESASAWSTFDGIRLEASTDPGGHRRAGGAAPAGARGEAALRPGQRAARRASTTNREEGGARRRTRSWPSSARSDGSPDRLPVRGAGTDEAMVVGVVQIHDRAAGRSRAPRRRCAAGPGRLARPGRFCASCSASCSVSAAPLLAAARGRPPSRRGLAGFGAARQRPGGRAARRRPGARGAADRRRRSRGARRRGEAGAGRRQAPIRRAWDVDAYRRPRGLVERRRHGGRKRGSRAEIRGDAARLAPLGDRSSRVLGLLVLRLRRASAAPRGRGAILVRYRAGLRLHRAGDGRHDAAGLLPLPLRHHALVHQRQHLQHEQAAQRDLGRASTTTSDILSDFAVMRTTAGRHGRSTTSNFYWTLGFTVALDGHQRGDRRDARADPRADPQHQGPAFARRSTGCC